MINHQVLMRGMLKSACIRSSLTDIRHKIYIHLNFMSVLAFVKETFSPMHIHYGDQSILVEISSPLYGLNPPKHSKTTIRHRHNSKMVEN